jgi:hypothetical protein
MNKKKYEISKYFVSMFISYDGTGTGRLGRTVMKVVVHVAHDP